MNFLCETCGLFVGCLSVHFWLLIGGSSSLTVMLLSILFHFIGFLLLLVLKDKIVFVFSEFADESKWHTFDL